jgi:hypothetical protein
MESGFMFSAIKAGLTRIQWKKLVVIGALLLSSSSCVHIERPHTGVVIDDETKKPLDGVVVTMYLSSRELFGTSVQNDTYESSSGSRGRFYLSPTWKWTRPLEFFTTRELYFHKAGYFMARVLAPDMYEKIELHRVRYLSDFREYQKEAEGNMDLHFVGEHKDKTTLFTKEMEKIASMSADPAGEPGLFAEVPGSALTRVVCATYGVRSPFTAHSETFATSGFPCSVFDEARQGWVYLTPEGGTRDSHFSVPGDHRFVTWNGQLRPVAFVNKTSIYDPSTITPPRHIKSQRGDISSVSGNTFSLLSVEDEGRYVCSYHLHSLDKSSCTAIDTDGMGHARMLALSKFYEAPVEAFYGVSQSGDHYIVHKINDADEHGRPTLTFIEIGKVPANAPFRDILVTPGGGTVYLLLGNGLKKLYAPKDQEGKTLQEDKAFAEAFQRLPFANDVMDFAVQGGSLYLVTGNANVYRIHVDGTPDFRISIHH